MECDEVGAYIRLLCYQWTHGAIPKEKGRLVRVAGGPVSDHVLAKFEKCADGELRNYRLEREREKQVEYRKKQSEFGKKGGRPKKGSLSKPFLIEKGSQSPPSPSPSPSPVPDLQSPISSKRGTGKPVPDAEWITSIKADPTYAGIDVDRELGKCQAWCAANSQTCSRKRFINWINRARPIQTNGNGSSIQKPMSVFELKTILQAKEAKAVELKNRHATETGLHTTWSNQQARSEFVSLKQEIRTITDKIASYAR